MGISISKNKIKIKTNFRFKDLNLLKSVLFISVVISFIFNFSLAETREELQARLKDLESQIAEQQKKLDGKKGERQTLERDISILNSKIKKTESEIKARDLSIKNLSYDIEDKETQIDDLSKQIETDKDYVEEMLRDVHYSKQNELITFLSNDKLSDTVDDINNVSVVQNNLKEKINAIQEKKSSLEGVKAELEDKKSEELSLKYQQLELKNEIEDNKKEKNTILTVTKGQEKAYQATLADIQKQASEIRTALFSLNSSNQSLTFGRAYELAKQAETLTGVRAAFILGILTVETNLGKNVGTGNWKTDMHPTRDQALFKEICESLGLDPDKQPVSKKAWYGYGGAMGPAQFIPSTWVMYKDRVSKVTGNSPANPWNPYDAITAAALLLKDNGAKYGVRTTEHRAAVCYLAGCGNASKASYQFYGNDVLKYADKYEANIEILLKSGQ